ncbi:MULTISPECIES: SAVMC3_10250 family protein [unclassified Streptomyces]|uniref:SAVMC3_10250 family protein n=1 Tax=unclassified Streptomyces TaxID=2593676 RepID=UPI0035AB72EA
MVRNCRISAGANGRHNLPELVYLSERKIRDELCRVGLPTSVTSTSGELSLTPKIAVSKAPRPPGDAGLSELFDQAFHFVNELAKPFTDPAVEHPDWISFDLPMGYSTGGRDGRVPAVQDIALFAGVVPGETVGQDKPVKLLLCGDARHLTVGGCKPISPDDPLGAGWMGSGTSWLYKLIRQIEDSDRSGNDDLPSALRAPGIHRPGFNDPEQVCQWVYRYIARAHPAEQEGRLKGHARVLLSTQRQWSERLVLATPLYIERSHRQPESWLTRKRNQVYRRQTA